MISLKSLQSPQKKSMVATFVGQGGIGKTSLAASFPGCVWIPIENPGQTLEGREDIALFPLVKNPFMDLQQIFDALLKEDHKFQTVVIDSITQLHTLFERYVIDGDPKKPASINTALGGYGAGHKAVANLHMWVRMRCEELVINKNMNVIFLAHADTETVSLPDQEPFQRYTIRMNDKSVSHYSDNVDLVGFIKLGMFVATNDGNEKKNRAMSDGTRIITCYPTPSHISKNRFGIEKDIIFTKNTNPFKEIL
jgi:hypothetical protein